MNQDFELPDGKLVHRVIAERMGVKHERIMQTLKKYRNQLLFQTGIIKKCDEGEDTGPSSMSTSEVQ
ncbi:MAG: hypothetical protein E6J34_15555 [Chloroflexi bacterium]|nr:MAG: hypothetical protein E6J34_15555 [Chloroflexota bacterium]